MNKARQSGAEPERRGEASKPETMRPSARRKSGGERSQSVHSTEPLPIGRERARKQSSLEGRQRRRSDETQGCMGVVLRRRQDWATYRCLRPTIGYPMWTEAMKGAVGPLRRAARTDDPLYHLNLFFHGRLNSGEPYVGKRPVRFGGRGA
jgi:hypothetical protein